MKYPKLRDGPTAIGESSIRALHQVSDTLAPFLKKETTPGTIGYKKNGFDEVHQKQGAPYLWGNYLVNTVDAGAQIYVATLSPEDHIGSTHFYGATYNFGSENVAAMSFFVHVGDNYVLILLCDRANTSLSAAKFWPSIARADSLGREYLSTEDGHARRTISYIDSALLTGLGLGGHYLSLWATGWKDSTERFRFGMTGLFYTDPTNPTTTRVPVSFIASTGGYAMTQVAYPLYSGRNHYPFSTFCVGPGKLEALNFVDNTTGSPTYAAPYLAQSSDHGSTWSAAATTWLTPYLHPPTGLTGSAAEQQQAALGLWTTIFYIGNGKKLLYIPAGYVDELAAGWASPSRYAPMLFLDDGSGYTRVSWPADTWYVTAAGAFLPSTDSTIKFTFDREQRAAHYAFGDDCMYVPVFHDGAVRIMSTRDAGSTWTFSPEVPAEMVTTGSDIAGAIIKPYVNTAKRGRILFAAPNYTTNRLNFVQTDGEFAAFKNIGAVVKAKGTLFPLGTDSTNYYYVNYGGKKFPPTVFPAFPGEFDKP